MKRKKNRASISKWPMTRAGWLTLFLGAGAASMLIVESNIVYAKIQGFSLSAYLTLVTPIILAIATFAFLSPFMQSGEEKWSFSRVRHAAWALLPLILLITYGLVSLTFSWRLEGLQNVLALAVFVTGILVFSVSDPGVIGWFAKHVFPLVSGGIALLFIATQIIDSEVRLGIEFFSPRQYAMVALVGLAAAIVSTDRGALWRILPYLIFSSIIFSASRTAIATGLVILLLAAVRDTNSFPEGAKKITAISLVSAGSLLVAAVSTRDVQERLSGGGFEQTGITSDSGRFQAWSNFLTLPSSPMDWLFGLGSGASAAFGQATMPAFPQTLNEYLRFLIDNGAIGLMLFVGGGLSLALVARVWSKSSGSSQKAAGFVLIALALVSFTDGALYSYFVVLPASLVIGNMFAQIETTRGSAQRAGIAADSSPHDALE